MRVTVAIATWNRAGLLGRTLAEMTKLRIPAGVEWKLLVANNHCTDNTDEVIARFADRLPIRRVFESRLGKSYACNLLVREATGDLILWTDDDVLVDSEWLVAYLDAAKAWPEAAFWGGRVDPLYGSVPPGWVVRNEAQVSHCFGLCQYERTVRPLAPGEYPNGSNMAFRLDVLRRFPFNPLLGKTGNRKGWCEDVELIDRMRNAGLLGVWVGAATVRHWVPTERMTYRYVWDWYVGQGSIGIYRWGLPAGAYWWGMPRWAIRDWVQNAAAWILGTALQSELMRVRAWRKWAVATGILLGCCQRSKRTSAGQTASLAPQFIER
jgi:glucosyl-dolichyl phosphate glucuronosyltransferase